MIQALMPKLFTVFQEGYNRSELKKDLIAGLIVAILAIPMSIAFSIASGARPEIGLHTAIIGAILGGLTTGSRFQDYRSYRGLYHFNHWNYLSNLE